MTHPRQTTAWNRPVSAACCAAIGISNAPGTRTRVISFNETPAAASADSAPRCRRSVMKSWYFETTIAKRRPAAVPPASIVVTSLAHPAHPVHPARPALFPLEFRLPLLEQRLCAFAHVFGGGDEAKQRRLVLTCRAERHLETLVDRTDDVAQGDWCASRKVFRELPRFGHQIGRGDDTIDEPNAQRLLCADGEARQAHLHRLRFADETRQPLCAGIPRDQ